MTHRHWTPEKRRTRDPEGWERVPAAEVFFHPETGRVAITGIPAQDDEDWTPEDYERGHSCDEMGCGSTTAHCIIHATVDRPATLSPATPSPEGREDGRHE